MQLFINHINRYNSFAKIIFYVFKKTLFSISNITKYSDIKIPNLREVIIYSDVVSCTQLILITI